MSTAPVHLDIRLTIRDFVRMDTDDIDRFLDKCQTVLLKDKRIPPGKLMLL